MTANAEIAEKREFVDETVSSIPIFVGAQTQPVAATAMGADVEDDENRLLLDDAWSDELLPEQSQPGELRNEKFEKLILWNFCNF